MRFQRLANQLTLIGIILDNQEFYGIHGSIHLAPAFRLSEAAIYQAVPIF
jgi:hypothetical protein